MNGISGDPFPTPFAEPAGKGLSAPWINVLWAFLNILVGYLLLIKGRITCKNKIFLLIFFVGVPAISSTLSITIIEKVKI